jgi:hypothetical protein
MLAASFAYSSTLKMEAIHSSEMLVYFYQKTTLFIVILMRTANLTLKRNVYGEATYRSVDVTAQSTANTILWHICSKHELWNQRSHC